MFIGLKNLLLRPYPLSIDFRTTFPAIMGMAIFLPLFLMIFQPFGLGEADFQGKYLYMLAYGPLVFLILAANYYGIPPFFPSLFDEEKWTVGKEFLWLCYNIFSGGLLLILFHFQVYPTQLSFAELFVYLLQIFMIAILPEAIYVLLTYNIFLQSRLRQSEQINLKLKDHRNSRSDEVVAFQSQNQKEKLIVPLEDLLFIQSRDNYADIVWCESDQIRRTLLRSSLKELENQIRTPTIMRCHRSFIVNLARVYAVNGNARNYRLSLERYGEPIPVARAASKRVLAALGELLIED